VAINPKILSIVVLAILAMMLPLAIAAYDGKVTLACDPNDPVPEGCRSYRREAGQAYDYSQPAWQEDATPGTVEGLTEGVTYYFVVSAYAGSQESADSIEVSYTPPAVVLKADLDGNGCVDAQDLAILAAQYGVCRNQMIGLKP
jgi:hypothetical protein